MACPTEDNLALEDHDFALTLSQEQEFEFSVQFDDATLPAVTMDEPPPLGEGHGPNAARLLGAAIGHCLSASLLLCLQKSRIDIDGIKTTVTGSIQRNDKGRFRITEVRVTLAPGVPDEIEQRFQRCLDIFEEFCIVTESVRQGIPVAVEVTPEVVLV